MAVADVYIDGIKKGSIDLGRPTIGDLTVGGATYLTAFEITGSVEVKIVLDPTNSIKEANEANNAMAAKITCQAAADTSTTTTTADPVAECIAKQQLVRGMSYDEAKKYCTTPVESSLSPIESCAKKYMQVFGVTYDEASKLCAAGQTPADVKTVINRCGELETKLNILMEKLRVAQGQDAESIMKDILALKTELRSCQVQTPQATKVVTPGIKNPCDELAMIKDSIAQIERKIIVIKEAISKGDMSETDLAPYMKEYNYLKERLEKMSFACQQGKPLEESPCARLSSLEVIYNEMKDKLAGTTVDKSSPKLMESVASIANEIQNLKQRCRGEKLDTEKVDTLYDLDKAYRAKQKAIVEGASDANMQGDLAKVEDEKKKLLDEFALRTSDLDARKSTIIRKLQIKDGNIILDDLKTKARKVKLDLKDKEIEIGSQDGGSSITDGSTTAQGDVPLEYSDGALISTKSGKEIKMMPGALMRNIEGKDYVKIDDDITWLPITIVFSATQLSPQPDPPGITLPAGTKGEKIGAGHYKFLLPDGQVVEIKNFDRKTKTGDVNILGKDGTATASDMKGTLTGSIKPKKSPAAILPSGLKELILKDDGTKPEYFAKVDKEGKLLWFIPTTISMEYRISAETGDVTGTSAPWWSWIALVDPDPPH
ncbi:MAG: CARDB domain-containing protein [Candidatus Methanoperedens sp.]|nr:CARDB domain-containing protein [Candidatus Methanoperedens sp.]